MHKLRNKRGFKKFFKNIPEQKYSSICLLYQNERKVALRIGDHKKDEFKKLAEIYFDQNLILKKESFKIFEKFIEQAIKLDENFRCYKDATDFIIEVRDRNNRSEIIDFKYPEGVDTPELNSLLKTQLYPYQKEAILKSAKAGRIIIADDMGLGKTIQAIAVTEIMAQEFGVEKVLIICPTSLKYQWKSEIEKFTNRSTLVIEGSYLKRKEQYQNPEFFKILTYNAVKNDVDNIKNMAPDLIILDEAQRIKNWKTKTAQIIKSIKSPYAIVLTGTPIENKLEELHSIVSFVNPFMLGPLFRFLANHQILDKTNKVVGYKDLHNIKKTLCEILIRRKKDEVLKELPKRIDKNCFVEMTEEQRNVHDDHYEQVCKLVNKWRRYKFLSEKDRQNLLIHLNCMRMVCDSTYILDEKTRNDTKIDAVMDLLQNVFEEKKEKVVIFSQWQRMTRLISEELQKRKIKYEYLHGGVPSKNRKDLLTNFHNDSESLVFLSTDAGGVGLNLQCASIVVNMDCPWNPAVLEQRIARVYRLGQKNL